MITKFGRLKAGDKFVSIYHGPQDSYGQTIWVKSAGSMAHSKDGELKKFEELHSVFKLKHSATIAPMPAHAGGES